MFKLNKRNKEKHKTRRKKLFGGKPILEVFRLKLERKLELAGSTESSVVIAKRIFKATIFITFLLSIYLIKQFYTSWTQSFANIALRILFLWIFVFMIILILLWIFIFVWYEIKVYRRTKELEEVLSDFLQIAASNIRSGMPIDRALWYSVKPRFGVLAKEIEEVAKQVMSGEELTDALMEFSQKYDSLILKRSIALIVEGIKAGGELGDLLNKVALNIKDGQIMKKEMAANVTTYVIFISFATVLAAPFLFALSYNLVWVIQSIMGNIDITGTGIGGFSIGNGKAVDLGDFRKFAILSLSSTSIMSSIIISTIKRGSAKESYRYIPLFIITTLLIFFVASWFLQGFLKRFLF